ncbi:MAG: hypothetical protein ACXABY_10970 [Candidatus Thorarchaeota archaeon]
MSTTTTDQVIIPSEENSNATNILTTGNQWNIEGIKDSRQANDGEIVTCTATKAELFYVDEQGYRKMLESCGECTECGLMFHDSYLHTPDGVDKASWPVFYVGKYCQDCWSK